MPKTKALVDQMDGSKPNTKGAGKRYRLILAILPRFVALPPDQSEQSGVQLAFQ